jgi:ADP-heptose:LPS heptosyltransferase
VINLLAKDSVSGAILTALSGARTAIGFEGSVSGVYDIVVPKPSSPLHIVPETSLLLAPLGIEAIGEGPARPAERLRIALPDATERSIMDEGSGTIVALNISGSSPEKYWGRDQFIELVRELRNDGLRPVIAAAPSDREELEAIVAATGAPALPITRSLQEFAAMLDGADIIVTPDTSIVHISAALGKPTVMLVPDSGVGNTWGPWGVQGRIAPGNGSIASVPVAVVRESVRSLVALTAPALHTS